MKFYVLIFFILLLFSCSENKVKKENKKTIEITDFKFDEEMHDFGKLESGEIVVYAFIFTNTGKHDLIIEDAESDCGCIQVSFPKEPVKPNKKGKIEIEFNSSGLTGRQLKAIDIHANCKEPKHLVIFAEVKNELFDINY